MPKRIGKLEEKMEVNHSKPEIRIELEDVFSQLVKSSQTGKPFEQPSVCYMLKDKEFGENVYKLSSQYLDENMPSHCVNCALSGFFIYNNGNDIAHNVNFTEHVNDTFYAGSGDVVAVFDGGVDNAGVIFWDIGDINKSEYALAAVSVTVLGFHQRPPRWKG